MNIDMIIYGNDDVIDKKVGRNMQKWQEWKMKV